MGEHSMLRQDYLKQLRGMLVSKRLEHSLRVSETAERLALAYSVDRDKAALAGLLHDCARDLPGGELVELAGKYKLTVDAVEQATPVLLHSPIGARLARMKFGITDLAVLRAIERHTLGDAGMTLLDKIVFIADKIEPGRRFPGVDQLRVIAFNNLNRALLQYYEGVIRLSLESGEPIHPRVIAARNDLIFSELKGRNFFGAGE